MSTPTLSPAPLPASRLHAGDVLRVGAAGLASRRVRALLSALGIAIGIAAMVAVLGISESSKAQLLSSLDRLGTNLLTVQASTGIGAGGEAELPGTAPAMLDRIGPVQQVAVASDVEATVRRTDLVPEGQTGGITVKAVDARLLDSLAGQLADGAWLDPVRSKYPVVVLGSVAAQRLGITDVAPGVRVWIGEQWFTVIGILAPLELAADLDRSALIGHEIAHTAFGTSDAPGTVYLRTNPEDIDDVRAVVPATADPEDPDQVEVSRPSDAIEARAAASSAYTTLFLGLGAVALLVGGVGIANVMVISVLERRGEIGLRRALGATRRHITVQFLIEALLLSGAGGLAGTALGALITAGYDVVNGWTIVLPSLALVGGPLAALGIGAASGLYPALRAARLAPTDALRTV